MIIVIETETALIGVIKLTRVLVRNNKSKISVYSSCIGTKKSNCKSIDNGSCYRFDKFYSEEFSRSNFYCGRYININILCTNSRG